MRPCYCLISGKPGISLRRLVRFQSHSNHVAVYASSKLPNIPLSTRCAFSVLKMWSCWSGRKVKNCWISLLGLGPLKHKTNCYQWVVLLSLSALGTQMQFHQKNTLEIICCPLPQWFYPGSLTLFQKCGNGFKRHMMLNCNQTNQICFKRAVDFSPINRCKKPSSHINSAPQLLQYISVHLWAFFCVWLQNICTPQQN